MSPIYWTADDGDGVYNSERFDMTKAKTRAQSAAATLGRLGGRAGTDAQNQARKQNAQLAGRPRRVCNFCSEPVIGGHIDKTLDETCGQHGWHWRKRVDQGNGHTHGRHDVEALLMEVEVGLNGELDSTANQALLARLREALR